MSDNKGFFLFRHGQFFRLWLGQVTSQAGTRLYQIAITWWIVSTAGSESGISLGIFFVAGALPALLFFRVIGKIVDRVSPKPLLVGSDLCSSAMMALVAVSLWNNTFTLFHAYIFSFLVALAEGFFNPTLSKCLPRLVPAEAIEPAVAYQTSTQQLASFGGAVLGALLIDKLGIPALVMLNSISYLFSAIIEITLVFAEEKPVQQNPPPSAGESSEPPKDGIDWTRFSLLRKLLIGFGFTNFFVTPILLTLPLYVKNSLNMGADTLGILQSALWLGILAGTFSATLIKSSGRTIMTGAGCMAGLGFFLLIPGFSSNLPILWASLFGAGASLGINNVKFVTLFQRIVPPEIKGRFFASMQAIISFTFPVAYLMFGFLGDILMPEKIFMAQGGGVMMISLVFVYLSRQENQLYNSPVRAC